MAVAAVVFVGRGGGRSSSGGRGSITLDGTCGVDAARCDVRECLCDDVDAACTARSASRRPRGLAVPW